MSHLDRAGKRIGGSADATVRVFLSFLISLSALAPLPIRSQTNPASGQFPVNRYLLVVETSRNMQRRMEGAVRAVQDLVGSGMHGQMHRDDSLGVWTFNESLYTGRLPVQNWSSDARRAITGQ